MITRRSIPDIVSKDSYLYLELLSGSSGYQRLVACILGYFLLPLNLLYSNSVFSELRGFPHSHVSVRVLPVGISARVTLTPAGPERPSYGEGYAGIMETVAQACAWLLVMKTGMLEVTW